MHCCLEFTTGNVDLIRRRTAPQVEIEHRPDIERKGAHFKRAKPAGTGSQVCGIVNRHRARKRNRSHPVRPPLTVTDPMLLTPFNNKAPALIVMAFRVFVPARI